LPSVFDDAYLLWMPYIDEFVVGYGMDFADMCRCLPFVAVLKPEAYAKPAISTPVTTPSLSAAPTPAIAPPALPAL
jgi:hypothetical protein